MNSEALELDLNNVARIVTEQFKAAPCAVVAAAHRSPGGFRIGKGCAGRLSFETDAGHATCDTVFDLASLTKPILALCVARLARAKELSLAEPLSEMLPLAKNTASAEISIELLLSHRAGLEAHRALFAPLVVGEPVDRALALRTAANGRRPDCVTPSDSGFPPVYSDLGYALVGAAIEERTGRSFGEIVRREISEPLGLNIAPARDFARRDSSFLENVAPTEIVPWRGGTLRGVVHDENAWALSRDEASGHAGLFADAMSTVRLGIAILDSLHGRDASFLEPRDLEPLLRDRPHGSLLLGFDRRSGGNPSSGSKFGPRTFGHLGFTGTSIWIDPDQELVGSLLTNRVHPTRATDAIRRARPAVYDALVDVMTRG